MMGLFGKKKDPKEQVRELQRKLRQEMRSLDRQVHSIQREEAKVTKEIKEAAKKGDREEQLATMRMAGSLQKSTEVMKSMQSLVKVPEIMKTMREMSAEMTKLGIIDEMIEDTMTSMEPEGLEEEANEEVDKILYEITAGELGKAPAAATNPLVDGPEIVQNEEFEAMTRRLAQLRD